MESKEIKNLRAKLKLTQKEFAGRLKVDAITVSRWERGEQKPDIVSKRKLTRLALRQLNRLAKMVS